MLRPGRGGPLAGGAGRRVGRPARSLSTYVRVGRYDLPAAAQEASAVTYDCGRATRCSSSATRGTAVVQVKQEQHP